MISSDILTDPDQVFSEDWPTVTGAKRFVQQITEIERLFNCINAQKHPNEQQTKQDLIFPILQLLGWPEFLVEQNLSIGRRTTIPDLLLFSSQEDKVIASKITTEAKRYGKGICIGEIKRWGTNLDRHTGHIPSPASQMLHYLRRSQDINNGQGAQWGVLTDGKKWRIYYARSQSVNEDFFEVDLGALIVPEERQPNMLEAVDSEVVKEHVLGLFVLFFSMDAFSNHVDLSRHLKAIAAGRHFESRVTAEMGDVIFNVIYPKIVQEIAKHEPHAALTQLRDESLLFLFRLLFVLYAEDRGLLPLHNDSYRYHRSFRTKVREKIREFRQLSINPAKSSDEFWRVCNHLWTDIAEGNFEFGLPAYNGDLFDAAKTPLLNNLSLDDVFMTEIIGPLSFQNEKYINYRTLNVQHLGAIYERLLARKVVFEDDELRVVSDPTSRKETGSYYTPDYLVRLTIDKTLMPLVDNIYRQCEEELVQTAAEDTTNLTLEVDPAQSILDLRVCDPAMGSAHFLVDAVDWLSDRVLEALAYCTTELPGYVSPLSLRITEIRERILQRAQTEGWRILDEQLDDRQIVKRLVLKKCIYGVDLNPMAVELAKLSLWLHTFTVGAPLSFLNHHLRCGNSIFGSWLNSVSQSFAGDIFQQDLSNVLRKTTTQMRFIEDLPDSDLDEVRQSEELFKEIDSSTAAAKRFLDVHLGLTWLRPANIHDEHDLDLAWLSKETKGVARKKEQKQFDGQLANWYEGRLGDPVHAKPTDPTFAKLWEHARELGSEQGFLHWEVSFPGVWNHSSNGFDAIVGNPPWERIKFEEAEWIAYRKPELARNMTQKEREEIFNELATAGDPLVQEFYAAQAKAKQTMAMVRQSGDYPLMSAGDINIYGLFAERALSLLNKQGICGLVLMAGIAADQSCVKFFQRISHHGRLRNFYHFENRRLQGGRHFADVHGQLKFCVFVASTEGSEEHTHYGCFVDDVSTIDTGDQCFRLSSEFFQKVNPNTGSIPILRSEKDKIILDKVYNTTPIFRHHGTHNRLYPVHFSSMFHMTNDRKAGKMLTSSQLVEQEVVHDIDGRLYPLHFTRLFDMTNDRKAGKMRTHLQLTENEEVRGLAHNIFDSADGRWLPLYEGKMIWQFDHRAADVRFNPDASLKRASTKYIDEQAHQDPFRSANPQFWVREKDVNQRLHAVAKQIARSGDYSEQDAVQRLKTPFFLGFRDITNTTDRRTMIATIIPYSAVSNTLCLLLSQNESTLEYAKNCVRLAGNFGSLIFDFVARCKLHANHMNWFILEQLPVIPGERYDSTTFGRKTAGDIVHETVLELVYTAHTLAPFAEALGYVADDKTVREPFQWDAERRLTLRAKLDAVYFHLYGITDPDDIDHVHSLFSVESRAEVEQYGSYRSKSLREYWVKALAAAQIEAQVSD